MFISYGALILFYICLQMIKKSVSWAFVYEILHYLKHGTDPLVLHEQMQLVIPKILAFKWVGSWRSQEIERACSVDDSRSSPNSRNLESTNSWTEWEKSTIVVIIARSAIYFSIWTIWMALDSVTISEARPSRWSPYACLTPTGLTSRRPESCLQFPQCFSFSLIIFNLTSRNLFLVSQMFSDRIISVGSILIFPLAST